LSIVSFRNILTEADNKGYAVGAFNISDLETVRAILEGAELEDSPVIIQIWEGIFDYVSADKLVPFTRNLIEKSSVPAALHLDHATTYSGIKEVIDTGFNSVMIDVSDKSIDENIQITRKVVEMARKHDVEVEAELGHVGSGTDSPEAGGKELLTNPEDAEVFVNKTGIDALAVAVGTAHGLYNQEPSLDFERLKELKERIPMPFVLHGGSDTPNEGIQECIRLGINKINVATDLNVAFLDKLKRIICDEVSPHFPLVIMDPARREVTKVVREKIKLFGSSHQA